VRKGCPYNTCIGFIDGTFRPVPRPGATGGGVAGGQQQQVYNAYYSGHGLKYQAVTLPNGMIGDMCGPVEGARHDARMYAMSRVETRLAQMHRATGFHSIIYGDSAYALTTYCQPAIRSAAAGAARALHHTMSGQRIAVEWNFGAMCNQWRFLDDEQNHKINLNAPGKVFICIAILHNLHNIKYVLVSHDESVLMEGGFTP
jgi:hypothetical protein